MARRPDLGLLGAGPARVAVGPAVLALSLAAPAVLVAGTLAAQAVQPRGGYDAIAQTVSTLAGRGAADRWVMAGALTALGVIYLVVAAGLRSSPRPARLVLGGGAVAVLVTALAPQPAHGSSTIHMTGMVIACLAFVGWPLALAAAPAVRSGLRVGSLAATLAMVVPLGWLCAQAWTDGTWLGAAERTLLLAQTVWPIRVAAASWSPRPHRPCRPSGELATLSLALLAPVVLVAGLVTAQLVAPLPHPLSQSFSALAGHASPTRGILTTTLVGTGVLSVLVATGLRHLPAVPRLLLGLGGAMVVVVALAPQPAGGTSALHMVAAGVAWAAFAAWPVALACSSSLDDRLRLTSALASVVLVLLLAWFVVELVTGGAWYGVSQRVVVAAQPVWPIRMAVHAVRRGRARPPA